MGWGDGFKSFGQAALTPGAVLSGTADKIPRPNQGLKGFSYIVTGNIGGAAAYGFDLSQFPSVVLTCDGQRWWPPQLRQACRFATAKALAANTYSSAAQTKTASANGALAIDTGRSPIVGDRILVKDEATATENGIYVVKQTGDGSNPFILQRDYDFNETYQLTPMYVPVSFGDVNGDTLWHMTGSILPASLDTTTPVFRQVNHDLTVDHCNIRLTLAASDPAYRPSVKLTPSSTDTGTDIITFAAAHGWATGTIVTPGATGGGLTQDTLYYARNRSSTTISLHTTAAGAIADTASITTYLDPSGIQHSTLVATPCRGNNVSLFDGTSWQPHKLLADVTIDLSGLGLSSATLYYVYIYSSNGTLTLDVSTTAYVVQNGVRVKNGVTTRRFIGWIYTVSTTMTEDSLINRYVINYYNRIDSPLFTCPAYNDNNSPTTYTTTSTTYVECNAGTNNKLNFISNSEDSISYLFQAFGYNATVTTAFNGVSADTTANLLVGAVQYQASSNQAVELISGDPAKMFAEGKHTLYMMFRTGAGTLSFQPDFSRGSVGSTYDPFTTYMSAMVKA